MLKSISNAIQNVMTLEEYGIYGMAQFNYILCERLLMFTIWFFPPFRFFQFPLSMTIAPGALSDMLISITSEPSECVDPSKRAFLPGS